MSKIADLGSALDPQFERIEMSDKLREAAQAEQEPVAWMWDQANYQDTDVRGRGWHFVMGLQHPNNESMTRNVKALYDAPPRREWVGLTDEEKYDCYLKIDVWSRCVEAVESKLREKNT